MAYNVLNCGYVDEAPGRAVDKGLGGHRDEGGARRGHPPPAAPAGAVPEVQRVVRGDLKAYLRSLHDPRIAAVISNLWDEAHVEENLSLAGRQIELRPA